jgi:predicted lysophospholipase L1 biosynthesis ABC-type transport system permease subunit
MKFDGKKMKFWKFDFGSQQVGVVGNELVVVACVVLVVIGTVVVTGLVVVLVDVIVIGTVVAGVVVVPVDDAVEVGSLVLAIVASVTGSVTTLFVVFAAPPTHLHCDTLHRPSTHPLSGCFALHSQLHMLAFHALLAGHLSKSLGNGQKQSQFCSSNSSRFMHESLVRYQGHWHDPVGTSKCLG